MTYPFGSKPPRGSRRSVPLEKAKKIANQRDRLAEEVKKLRRENEQLAENRAQTQAERQALEQRLADAEEKIQKLQAELEAAESNEPSAEEATLEEPAADEETDAELVDKLKRRIANLSTDLDRVRRQADDTEASARRDERIRLLSEFGTILDSVEQGLSMASSENERQGLEGIYSQILNYLRREGATLTGEVGAEMDPHIHEAVDTVETPEYASGQITDVVRRGVQLEDGTVVLPAKVQVAA